MSTGTLQRTIRRCTAVLVAVFAPALEAISNYSYSGRVPLALAVGYLVFSLGAQFVDVDPGDIESPTDADGAEAGPDGSDGGPVGDDASGP